jgi:hypothetical protein
MEIGYKLKTPCNDCPFKKSSPLHEGVMRSLPEYDGYMKSGSFAHTCHKTDSRSDGYVDNYGGQIQHCAGALIMFKNMELSAGDEETTPDGYPATQSVLIHAVINKLNVMEMEDPDVFPSFLEMAKAYKPMIEELEEKQKSGVKVHVSYANGKHGSFYL